MTAHDLVAGLLGGPSARLRYCEEVTLLEHMLQTAALAEAAGADPPTRLAALLHDVGHLVHAPERDEAGNPFHADVGAELLAGWFPPEVTEPVRLHVAAKRYLVAVDPEYAGVLSPASAYTLGLQGGPLTADQCRRFEAEPYRDPALAVRRWDEQAKVAGRQVPGLGHHRTLIADLRER